MDAEQATTDATDRFAAEATRFERWLLDGVDRDASAAREALIRILALYRAALDLPPQWSDELNDVAQAQRVGAEDRRRATAAAARLPLNVYREVFDPTEADDETSVVGSLVDDLGDIYGDVATGLRAYEKGDRAVANWEWAFNFRVHWGAHATSAIRALHWWLADNYFER